MTEANQTSRPVVGRLEASVRRYPLSVENVGEDTYILMSRGHHDVHEFMRAVRADGYTWPLGMPTHEWMRAIPAPNGSGFRCLYVEAKPGARGAFPATYAREAYGEDRYEALEYARQIRPLTQQDWGFIFDVLEGTKLDVPRIRSEVARLQREAAKSERRAITFGDIVHTQVLAMRAAYVDAKLNGSDAGMAWIENTLEGPGQLPDLAAAKKEGGAQVMFNREMAEHEAFRAAHPAP